MRIETYGHEIEVTPALREYVETKLKRLERHFEQPCEVRTQLGTRKPDYLAEATVNVSGRTLHADAGARFDRVVTLKAEDIRPQVTWGTSPEMVVAVDAAVPDPAQESDPVKREGIERALKYMGLAANKSPPPCVAFRATPS